MKQYPGIHIPLRRNCDDLMEFLWTEQHFEQIFCVLKLQFVKTDHNFAVKCKKKKKSFCHNQDVKKQHS